MQKIQLMLLMGFLSKEITLKIEYLICLSLTGLSKDQCKQEVHDQTLVGKKADSAVFGFSVAQSVRELALERTTF